MSISNNFDFNRLVTGVEIFSKISIASPNQFKIFCEKQGEIKKAFKCARLNPHENAKLLEVSKKLSVIQEKYLNSLKTTNDINTRSEKGLTPLHYACQSGDLEAVKTLLALGADIKITNGDKQTPLHIAAELGHADIIDLLLKKGANAGAKDAFNLTPLHLCAQNGNIESASLLIKAKTYIQAKDVKGMTPLHYAAEGGHANSAKLLLANSADVNCADVDGITPLMIACCKRRIDVAKVLLENGAHVNAETMAHSSPLLLALNQDENPSLELIQLLIENGAKINHQNKSGSSALLFSSMKGYPIEIIKCLLQHGADIHQTGKSNKTCLYYAAANGHFEIIELLLNAGANINAQAENGETALFAASIFGHSRIVEFLLKRGAKIDLPFEKKNIFDVCRTPLLAACEEGQDAVVDTLIANSVVDSSEMNVAFRLAAFYGKLEVIKTLKKHDANLFAELLKNGSETLLHQVCGRVINEEKEERDHIAIIDYLISEGVSVDVQNSVGYTPLHLACIKGLHLISLDLLASCADINAKATAAEYTPLHLAIIYNKEQIVKNLLDAGADINIKNHIQATPLHIAVQMKSTTIVNSLLERDPILSRNIQGKTPIDLAREENLPEITKLLKSHFKAKKEKALSLKKCNYCGAEKSKERPIKKCSGCSTVYYCGKSCQVKDWGRHKADCSPEPHPPV